MVTVSTPALQALRSSNFLFARKFKASFNVADDCELTSDTWAALVFGTPAPPVVNAQTWMGEGIWIDSNGQQVSVFSDEQKPHQVAIQNAHQPEWSGWATTCGEHISIAFQNHHTMKGWLDPADGCTLTFSNGVHWHRDLPWRGDGAWRDSYQ